MFSNVSYDGEIKDILAEVTDEKSARAVVDSVITGMRLTNYDQTEKIEKLSMENSALKKDLKKINLQLEFNKADQADVYYYLHKKFSSASFVTYANLHDSSYCLVPEESLNTSETY